MNAKIAFFNLLYEWKLEKLETILELKFLVWGKFCVNHECSKAALAEILLAGS